MASPGQTSGPKPTPWPPLTLPFVDLFSGSVAGAAQVIVGQPLDTIKTRAQTAARGQFKGPTDILVQTVRREGVLALYKGMASPLMGIALQNSLLFTAFQLSRRAVSPETSDLTTGQTTTPGRRVHRTWTSSAQSIPFPALFHTTFISLTNVMRRTLPFRLHLFQNVECHE